MFAGGFFEIADEGVLERGGAAPPGEVRRRIGREHAPGIHQRDAIAALGLVHEMSGDENRHALIARQVDQQFPEPVPRQRIDARGRLVEDEHFRLVNDGDGQRQPLANAERQIRCALIEMLGQAELRDQRHETRPGFARGQMKQPGVQIEVLPDRQFGVERKRLRHVTDAKPRRHVARVERFAEQQRFAFAWRQQSGQHLHRGGFAAAVGADEAEYLAALDGEIDPIDGGEIAEAAGQIAGDDHRLGVGKAPRRHFELVVAGAQRFGQQRDKGLLDGRGIRMRLKICRRARGQNASGVHSDQKVEALGLFHVGGRHHHAHAGPARRGCDRSIPRIGAATADRRRWSVRRE